MKHRFSLILIAVLLAITALCAFLHLSGRTDADPGELIVCSEGRQHTIDFDNLPQHSIKGEIVNGKGDVLPVSGSGASLSDVLISAGIDPEKLTLATVIASDEYHAELTGNEICQPEKAWLLLQEDGSFRLIVFGDPDSKRNVTNVVRVEAE